MRVSSREFEVRDLERILDAYTQTDASLEAKRTPAAAASVASTEARQVLNDQAYFLLCWGQLETEINARCREAIRRRREDPDWQTRRGWDLYNPDDPRLSGLSFEDRVRLVLDMQGGRGSPFAKVMVHYEMRNKVAHGRLESRRVDVRAVVGDFHLIQAALHRAA